METLSYWVRTIFTPTRFSMEIIEELEFKKLVGLESRWQENQLLAKRTLGPTLF